MTWNADELNLSKPEIKEYIDKEIFNSDEPAIGLFQEIHKDTLEKYHYEKKKKSKNDIKNIIFTDDDEYYIFDKIKRIRGWFILQKSWNNNKENEIYDSNNPILLHNIQIGSDDKGIKQFSYNGVMWSKHFIYNDTYIPTFINKQLISNPEIKQKLGIRSSYMNTLLYNHIYYNVISVHGLINKKNKNQELFNSIMSDMVEINRIQIEKYINVIGGDFNIKKSEIPTYVFQDYESDNQFTKTNKNYDEEKKKEKFFYEKLDYIYYKTDEFINVKSETIGNFDDNYKFKTSDHLPVQITIDVKEYTEEIKKYLEWKPTNIKVGKTAIKNPSTRCFQIAAIQLIFHSDIYRKAILKEGYFNKSDDNLLLHYLYEYFKYLLHNYDYKKYSFSEFLSKEGVNLSELNIDEYNRRLYECHGGYEDAADFLDNLLKTINLNNRKIKIIEENNEIILSDVYNRIDSDYEDKKEYNIYNFDENLYCEPNDLTCYNEPKDGRVELDKDNDYYKKILAINDVSLLHYSLDDFNYFNKYSFFDSIRKINDKFFENQIINYNKYHTNNIIIIQIKRFSFDQTKSNDPQKDEKPIPIDENIINDNGNYKLKGFIEHKGPITHGHYISYIKVNDNWYCFNDKNVFTEDPKLRNNKDVYILLYEKDKAQSGGYYKKYIKYKQKYINKSIYENYNSNINYYNKYIKYKQKYLLK